MTTPAPSGFHRSLALLLAGPLVWLTHFGVVYLVAEAACAVGGVRLLGASLPTVVSVAATVAAAPAALVIAHRAWRGWRETGSELRFTGMLLGLFAAVAVLFQGLPPLVLPPC